jgi:tetratricopeptide (TPR) repeat protein
MATSEIEKLERRYAENPHGLTFAPLAEVHRKNGDISRALELLRVGLELHPNYIPASIVLGRCHQDLGDLSAAEEAFSHVLRLDDENVIALKSLADINERQEKLDDAERWLRRLVSVDRSNEEAREQLHHLETLKALHRRRAAAAGKASSSAEAVQEPAPKEPTTPPQVPEQTAPEPPAPPQYESLDLTAELSELKESPSEVAVPLAPAASPVQPAAPPRAEESPAPPIGPSQGERSSAPVEPPKIGTPEAPVEDLALPGLIREHDQTPQEAPPTQTPLGLEIETEQDVVLKSSGATEFSAPDAAEDMLELAAKLSAQRRRSHGRRATDRPPAERQTAAPPPPPASPPPTRSSQDVAPESVTPKEPAPSRSYLARDTKGQSVADFFKVLLASRPPEGSAPSKAGPQSEPVARDGRSESTNSAVSFDDFFGTPAKDSTPAAPGGEPSKEDLDQFQSWLQNLKR